MPSTVQDNLDTLLGIGASSIGNTLLQLPARFPKTTMEKAALKP